MLRMAAALTRGELTAPDLLRRPIPYSPPAHVCTPGVWNGRREFKGDGRRGDKVWLWWREVFGLGSQPVQ